MFLDEAYYDTLKTLTPKKKSKKQYRKRVQEKPEVIAITGLTAHAISVLVECADMFNAAMANAMLEVADIFERQQNKLEEGISLVTCRSNHREKGMIQ